MTLSQIIQETEYWYRRLSTHWISYRRARNPERSWHRDYCRRIIANIREWETQYNAWGK